MQGVRSTSEPLRDCALPPDDCDAKELVDEYDDEREWPPLRGWSSMSWPGLLFSRPSLREAMSSTKDGRTVVDVDIVAADKKPGGRNVD